MARFLTIVDGVRRLANAIAQSVGVSDAGKIVETHDNGRLHNSLINWDAPGAIGGTTPAAIGGTTGSFSGNVALGSGSAINPNLTINGTTSTIREIIFQTNGSNRWNIRSSGVAETGGNAGSTFQLIARDDAGSLIDSPFEIFRSGSIVLRRQTIFSNTTESTSTSSGALTISGGVGISGNMNAGGNLTFNGTSHRFGANANNGTIVQINGAANTFRQLRFLTAGATRWSWYINSTPNESANAGGNLHLSYYNDAGAYVGDAFRIGRSNGFVTFPGAMTVSNATASTSSTTGALTVSGGVGVGGALNVGGNITGAQFRLPALNAAPASLTATGTLGETRIASDGLYVCVGSNSWRRALFTGAANAAAYYTYLASLSPTLLIPLEDSDGNILFDRDGADIGFYSGTYALQRPSLLSDPTGRSVLLRSGAAIVTSQIFNNPNPFTIVCRFRASATATGSLFGFGNTTDFSPSSYDRSVYLNGNTVAMYGWTGSEFNLDTSVNVRDNLPHTLVIRVSSGGTSIWIDGVQAASTASVLASNYNGYWRIGHSLVFGSRQNFAGFANGITMAGVAIFSSALSDAQIAQIHANA